MRKTLLAFLLCVTVCAVSGCQAPNASTYETVNAVPAPTPVAARTENASLAKTDSRKVVVPKPAAEKPVVVKKEEVATPAPRSADAKAQAKAQTKPAPDMKVANAIERNPYLSSIVKPLLPPRMTMTTAAAGFKNDKQFIAVLHASRNLGIPFNEIKMRMTGNHHMSLNDALRDVRPEMTKNLAKAEAHKGEEQAKDDQDHAKDLAKRAAAQEKLAANKK